MPVHNQIEYFAYYQIKHKCPVGYKEDSTNIITFIRVSEEPLNPWRCAACNMKLFGWRKIQEKNVYSERDHTI